jgi:hypothetical protein
MIYLICLDVTERDNPAARVDAWVRRSYDTHLQPLPGCWIVSGPLAAEQIHTALRPLLGGGDRLLIVKAASEAIWHGLDYTAAAWLADNFPGSISERISGKTEGINS